MKSEISPLPSNLPEPVAQICSRLDAEKHDAIRFFLFLDCYEVAVQFSTAVAISAARENLTDNDRQKLLAQISANLQSPSLGHFGNWLKWCLNGIKSSGENLWSAKLQPIGEAVDGPFNNLRNRYRGHGGTIAASLARRLVGEQWPKLIPVLEALRGFIVESGECVGHATGIVAAPTHASYHRLLIRDPETRQTLDLYPLLVMQAATQDCPARFLFFNGYEKGGARYVDYAAGEPTIFEKEHPISRAFAKMFPLPSAEAEKREFIATKTKGFVGRERELARLAKFAEGGSKRALIVSAPPGTGKSSLLARWSQQERVFLYLLRERDADSCKPEVVFATLAREAADRFQLPLVAPKSAGARQWCEELFRLLEEVPADSSRPIVVLDGLDEAERVSRRDGLKFILDCLPSAGELPGRSRWVFSIRPELRNDRRFKEKLSSAETENLDLGKLGRNEIGEFLREAGQLGEIEKHRGLLQRIVRCSEGSPLYLSLLVRDLREGRKSVAELSKPPQGLAGIYESYLAAIKEGEREKGKAVQDAQKTHAKEFLKLLSDKGLIPLDRVEGLRREECKRLDANAAAFSPDFLALFAVARAPLLLEVAAGMIGEPLEKLESETGPIRSIIVEDAEGFWTLFHSDFRRHLEETRPKLLAAARMRIVRWVLRYQEHESAYALKHLVAHLCELLTFGTDGPEPKGLAGQLLHTLTDLRFIELRVKQDDVAGLRADYELARSFWPAPSSANVLALPPEEPIGPWQKEAVEDVLDGVGERHLDSGSGPVLAALRERWQKVEFNDDPSFPDGQEVPEDWFAQAKMLPTASNARPVQTAAKPGTTEAMHEFAAFVEAASHHLESGVDLLTLAFNFSAAGIVSAAAERLLSERHQPWIRRHNRPNRLPGNNPELLKLPDSAGVTPDLSSFVTFGSVGTKANRSVRIQRTSLRMASPPDVLEAPDPGWLSSQGIGASTTGDRVMNGNLVADFQKRQVFTLDIPRPRHKGSSGVRAVAMTPDGRMAAIAVSGSHIENTNDYISIWNLETRQKVRTLNESDPEVHALAMSADGRVLTVGRHVGGSLAAYDVCEGRSLLSFYESDYDPWAGRHIRAVAMTPDARFVVCGGSAQRVWILDLLEGRVLRCLGQGLGEINAVAITSDGRTVAAFSFDGGFRVWDVKTGCLTKNRLVTRMQSQLLLSHDASSAVVSSEVLDLRAIGVDDSPKPVAGAVSSDGSFALLGRMDGSVVRSAFSGSDERVIFERSRIDSSFACEPSELEAVYLNANSSVAVLVFDDSRIYRVILDTDVWREAIPRRTLRRLINEALPRAAADSARIMKRDLDEAHVYTSYPIAHTTLTPDGQFVVTAAHREAIRVWNCVTGKQTAKLSLLGHKGMAEGEIECLKPLPDSSGIVFTTFDGALHLWQWSKMKTARLLRIADNRSYGAQLAVSPDGLCVAWVCDGSPIEIRSLPDGDLIQSSADRPDYTKPVEWCGADWLAVAVIIVDDSREQWFIEIREVSTLKCLTRYPLSSPPATLAAASGANRLVCCTEDGQTHYLGIES